jgi:hypothetical protein
MNADEAVVALVGVLKSLAIPYMVSGSLATNVYGVPRATDDGDFVLELPPGGRIADIAGALPEAIRLEPQVQFETVTASDSTAGIGWPCRSARSGCRPWRT